MHFLGAATSVSHEEQIRFQAWQLDHRAEELRRRQRLKRQP
jgi:hypothetical protein